MIEKWTEYYGGIRHVTLDVDEQGKWLGSFSWNASVQSPNQSPVTYGHAASLSGSSANDL